MFFSRGEIIFEMAVVDEVLRCLREGKVPEDPHTNRVCVETAKIFTEFRVYAQTVGEPISLHICVDAEGRAVQRIHRLWFALSLKDLVNDDADSCAYGFPGAKMFTLTDRASIHVAFTRLVEYNCPVCDETYRSEINCARCKASHANRKKPNERSVLRLGDMISHWDGLGEEKRRAIAKCATKFLAGVDRKVILSDRVLEVVDVAAGKVDLPGHHLAVGLDEASEYTFPYRMAAPAVLPVPYNTADHVASIADALVTALAASQTEAAAQDLLRVEELEAARRAEVKEAQRMRRVEKMVWRTPAAVMVNSWADQE